MPLQHVHHAVYTGVLSWVTDNRIPIWGELMCFFFKKAWGKVSQGFWFGTEACIRRGILHGKRRKKYKCKGFYLRAGVSEQSGMKWAEKLWLGSTNKNKNYERDEQNRPINNNSITHNSDTTSFFVWSNIKLWQMISWIIWKRTKTTMKSVKRNRIKETASLIFTWRAATVFVRTIQPE